MLRRTRPMLVAATVVAIALPAFAPLTGTAARDVAAQQGEVYPGAQYREEYIDVLEPGAMAGLRPDTAVQLHADVLRSSAVAWSVRQPVVLVVSPYTNHNDGGADLTDGQGPNPRFYDFLEVTGALDRGYTFVQVDLPGNGGSSGCNDWGGPVEQRAVKEAVEWAAAQPWSTGKVGMLGKSYDGWTGLMGMAQDPTGLAAVVSLEPVFSGYRYGFNDGVRFGTSATIPASFTVYDAQPGALNDDPQYLANNTPQVYCYPLNAVEQQQDSEDAAFWAARNLVELAAGSDTPLLLMQGFLESNTKPDAAFSYFNAMANPANRLWVGQWNHVRGWERNGDGRYETGSNAFAAELNRFLDLHLKGIRPTVVDPAIRVQDNLGRHRAEAQWPPADSVQRTSALAVGSYTDGSGSTTSTTGIWSVGKPLTSPRWMAGEPVLTAVVSTTAPRTNLVANVYDVAPDGSARLMSRGTTLVRGVGEQRVDVAMYGQDWMVATGHRVAVRIVGGNTDWWVHVPTGTTVEVLSADITLPMLTRKRTRFLPGGSTPQLERHMGNVVDFGAVTATEVAIDLGPALR